MADDEQANAVLAARGALADAGFRPARHAALARLIRRVIWPFIRPFHFFTLDQILTLRAEAAEASATHADDTSRLVLLQSGLRAELVAVSTRLVALEDSLRTKTDTRLAMLEERLRRREAHPALFLTVARDGVFLLRDGDLISESVRESGRWDEHVTALAERAAVTLRARPGAPPLLRAIDAGAHFGVISVALASHFDRVTSFEANHFNAAILTANIALNRLGHRVDLRHAALGATAGRVSLAPSEAQDIPLPRNASGEFDPLGTNNLGAYSFIVGGTGLNEIEAMPLDALALEDVAFIKVDVQGADGEVLTGAMATIARCRPWIVFEWEEELSRHYSVSFEDLTARLRDLDYELRVLKRHNEKQTDYVAAPRSESDALPAEGLSA